MMDVQYEDGTTGQEEVEFLTVKGFWKPVVDAGYLTDDTVKWQYYGGAIVPMHGPVGTFKSNGDTYSLHMISFFTNGNGGYADGAVCGAFTDEGHIAFVDMETGMYDSEGEWWFTALGVFDSKNNYQGDMISYDEMMFVDGSKMKSAKSGMSSQSMLNQVKKNFQKNYNFVEYKRYQLYDAIDEAFGTVQSFGSKAGIDADFERPQPDCSIEFTSDLSTGTFRYNGMPLSASSRK